MLGREPATVVRRGRDQGDHMLPARKAIKELLVERLGRRVDLAPGVPFAPAPGEGATFAVFVDSSLRTRAVAACDLAFSAYAGAAVATVPAGGAEQAIDLRRLEPGLEAGLRTVFEDLAALLAGAHLHAVYAAGAMPPSDIPAYAGVLGHRLDLAVTISAYGPGRFSLVCL
jgi:hypothetical protein